MTSPDKIRVLIVDDISETRESIRRMLQFEPSIEVIGVAENGKQAIEMAQQAKPDVVIMDINMPDIDGITATEQIRKKVSYIQVVILSVQSDPSYMRRAMLAGARDFLAKPPMIDELVAAVKRAGAMAVEEKSKAAATFPTAGGDTGQLIGGGAARQLGKVVVVYSPKGGTGTTTLATNLAVAFQQEDNKVVLVDGSLQFGDVAVMLNEQGKNNLLDLTRRADELEPEIIEEVAVKHTASNLRILACPPRPEMADSITGEQFGKLLEYLKQLFNFVIVDTTSYLTEVAQSAIDCADRIVLITTQDIPSIKSCNLFLSLASATGIRQRIVFVMNRYDKRLKITPEKVGESLHQEIIAAIPFDEKIIPNSVNRGVPFVLENRTYPVSKSVLSLADIIAKSAAKEEPAAERDLMGKK